ncbi:DUF58 domain-containing protein [Legionella adelaidensis]|nr:DUF58 domain-containing protein [Legionella adelaidensis]
MTDGIVADISELIDLKRYARSVKFHPQKKIVRAGNHVSKIRGRGMDFAEVRNYQPGDEIRHMEWRITARTGKPHVKLYEEERERPVVVIVDFNPSMYFGTRVAFKSVVAARLASLIAWTTVKQGDRIGGLLFSADRHSEYVPMGRDAGVLTLLSGLSQYSKEKNFHYEISGKPLSQALLRARRVIRPGSILVLISDFYNVDNIVKDHLSRLRVNNEILAYHICDPLELSPPRPQQYAISNGSQELLLDTADDKVSQAYSLYCDNRIENLRAMLKSLHIQYAQVTAEMDVAWVVRGTFPRRN